MAAIEAAHFYMGVGAQTAQGTAATNPDIMLRGVTNATISPASETVSEPSGGDSRKYRDDVTVKAKIGGNVGTPAFQATPTAITYFLAKLGNVVKTGSGVTKTYTITASDDAPEPLTFFKGVGRTTKVSQLFVDSRVTQLDLNLGLQQRIGRLSAAIMSLKPGVNADPTATLTPVIDDLHSIPFVFSDLRGSLQIPEIGSTHRVSDVRVTWTDSVSDYQGDRLYSEEFVEGFGSVVLSGTVLLDQDTIDLLNLIWYGTTSPAVGATISESIYMTSSPVSLKLSRGSGDTEESVEITLDRSQFEVAVELAGNPEGGVIELPFTATSRPAAGGNAWSAVCKLPLNLTL
jgi:hypothetical protein